MSLPPARALRFQEATSADVPAMARCRAADADAGPADERMARYFDGQHHPQKALAPRTGFVARSGDEVIGYIAGHATTRYDCEGEVQYLYVSPQVRRRGVAAQLLRLLAGWFDERGIRRVCVDVDRESPGALPFYVAAHAVPLNRHWYVWDDIRTLASADEGGHDGAHASPSRTQRDRHTMAAKKSASNAKPKAKSTGSGKAAESFTEEERDAMRERVRELKRARSAVKGADEASEVLAKIATMTPQDRAMAERLHGLITAAAPSLVPRLWYGMPAYAKDGKVVCFFQGAQKFKTRYATLGFSDQASLDEGEMWPTSFALNDLTASDEARISALVKRAVG